MRWYRISWACDDGRRIVRYVRALSSVEAFGCWLRSAPPIARGVRIREYTTTLRRGSGQ